MTEKNLQLLDISKSYGKQIIFNNDTFSFKEGYLSLLVGPNGAGKTTLLDIISGDEEAVVGDSIHIPKDIYYFKDIPEFFNYDKVNDFIKLIGASYQKEISDENLNLISSILQKRICDLSTGEKQKLIIVSALVAQAEITLLDEPTNGIDEEFKSNFKYIFTEMIRKSKFVLVTTHLVEDFKEIKNEKVFVGKYQEDCKELLGGFELCFPLDELEKVSSFIKKLSNSNIKKNVMKDSVTLEIYMSNYDEVKNILEGVLENNIIITSFKNLGRKQ